MSACSIRRPPTAISTGSTLLSMLPPEKLSTTFPMLVPATFSACSTVSRTASSVRSTIDDEARRTPCFRADQCRAQRRVPSSCLRAIRHDTFQVPISIAVIRPSLRRRHGSAFRLVAGGVLGFEGFSVPSVGLVVSLVTACAGAGLGTPVGASALSWPGGKRSTKR